MLKKILIFSSLAVFLTACNEGAKKVEQLKEDVVEVVEEVKEEVKEEVEEHFNVIDGLFLNDGEKWLVNEEMKPHVLAGRESVEDFVDSNGSDYLALAETLKGHNQNLIKSCTMTGTPHDALHEWLAPHLDLTKELEDAAANEEEAKALVAKLQESYKEYDNYFN